MPKIHRTHGTVKGYHNLNLFFILEKQHKSLVHGKYTKEKNATN